MSDEPTTIDWNLHMTRGHTPMSDWHKRNSLDHYYSAEADEWLVKVAPMFREEVIRLRKENQRLLDYLVQVADEYTDADGITYEIYCKFGDEEE